MSKAVVREFSHHFTVKTSKDSSAMKSVVSKLASMFDHYDWKEGGGQWGKEFVASYSSPSADVDIDWDHPDLEYRFHINALSYFKLLLEKAGARAEDVEYIKEPSYETVSVQIEIKDYFKPFDDQKQILEQTLQLKPISKLLGSETGSGKSVCAIFSAAHWASRTVAFMKPGYVDKWANDFKKQTLLADDDIFIIGGDKKENKGGSERLAYLIEGLMNGWLNPKVVLISNATFRNWISNHEAMPPGEYVPGFKIHPWEFFQACGFGFRIIDETHQDFHFNFLLDLYTHVDQSLSLSATLISSNEYLMKMYKMAYPEAERVKVPELKKYIRSIAWMYEIHESRRIQTSTYGRTSYSHVEFEKSIMRSKKLMKQYLLMVYETMRRTYLVERKVGQKCIIYFATRKLCEEAMFYYRQMMPEIKFAKYNQGDSLVKALEADVMIATLQKAGTAIDIPYLTTVILTVAIDSIQSNLQSSGRLRDLLKLYGLDRMPDFVYFVCRNIDKHLRYHHAKQDIMKHKAAVSTVMHHNVALGYN